MLDRITVDELTTSSPAFANAMLAAGHLSTDQLVQFQSRLLQSAASPPMLTVSFIQELAVHLL
jgi:hypothetical protein